MSLVNSVFITLASKVLLHNVASLNRSSSLRIFPSLFAILVSNRGILSYAQIFAQALVAHTIFKLGDKLWAQDLWLELVSRSVTNYVRVLQGLVDVLESFLAVYVRKVPARVCHVRSFDVV